MDDDPVIYGLIHRDRPRLILYVGTTCDPRRRLMQHYRGNTPATKRHARLHGIDLFDLRMLILRRWPPGQPCPEWHVVEICQAFGMAPWNDRYHNEAHGNPLRKRTEHVRSYRRSQHFEARRQNGIVRNHVYWHIRLGRINQACPLCWRPIADHDDNSV